MPYFLKPGFIFFAANPTMIMTVLGSSVAISLHDRRNQIGGMNHFVHPQLNEGDDPTALFAAPATHKLVRLFLDRGYNTDGPEAHLFGGAAPEGADMDQIAVGLRNLKEAETLLNYYNIPVVGRDVGGTWGRKIAFNTGTGEIIIAKVNHIRGSDWFHGQPWSVS